LRKRGDCHEDGLLHSLERFIEKIRPKEKAGKRVFCSSSSVFLRLKSLAQRDDLCGQLHVVYPGRYSCGSVSAVFTCGEKAYIAKQKKSHG
jgi:hypothetical protein